VGTPIRCAESNVALHFPVWSLLLEAEAKTFPILPFLNLHPQAPSSTVKTPLERVDTPTRCAESNAALHFPPYGLCFSKRKQKRSQLKSSKLANSGKLQ